jgi:lipid A disaccharide synthetase
MRGIITSDRGKVVERAFKALCESGEWANLEKEIATANNPMIVAWKIGFYHAMVAYDQGAIRVIGHNKDNQN